MSERPAAIPEATEPLPCDSASGILLRSDGSGGRSILLGVRARRSRFMPGHLAFPGGRLEPVDRPDEAGALARCAAREIEEETGIRIEVERLIAAGERITPPIFPLRFRNAFFVAECASREIDPVPSPGEIESLHWIGADAALDDWRRGLCKIPPPVLPILRQLALGVAEELPRLARRIAAVNAEEERAPRIEFVPDVWMLPVRTETLPPATHTNVWMPGGRRFVIIDPGSARADETERLMQVVSRRRQEGQSPTAIVLTHHHRDHVSGAAALSRELDLPVLGHPATLERLASSPSAPERCEPLEDSDRIDLDGMTLTALHTPGHADGHLAFILDGRDACIAGDLLSGLSTILIDPQDGDMGCYLESLRRIRAEGCALLLPGHGPPLPGGALGRLLDHRHERERKISRLLGELPVDLQQIATGAYDDIPEMPATLTCRQTLAHLLHLERSGAARRGDPEGQSWSGAAKGERR